MKQAEDRSAPTALVLGKSGKLGSAMMAALARDFAVVGTTSADLDARDAEAVARLVRASAPAVVVNCIAKMGIPACEEEPQTAFALNTQLPGQLADLSRTLGFKLVHFSTDSVFPDRPEGDQGVYVETDAARPLNTYGITKFGGDCHVQARANDYLLVRISVLFGPSPKGNQFVERMLARAARGQALSVAHDVIGSPSYSLDVAGRVAEMIVKGAPAGLHHVANLGRPSLHELMVAATAACGLSAEVHAVSHESFPSVGVKNRRTPIGTVKGPSLRPWREALAAYCAALDLDRLRQS
ncbi:MAG TPA: SDR family oxidoreductase [Polyangia bacterium]